MAIDSKTVISIDAEGAKVTISQLKDKVKEYREELDNCVVGSQEAKDASDKLAKAQTALAAAQKGAIDAVGKLDNSYNGLSKQMRKLKDEQKALDVSTEEGKKAFQEYAKKINDINTQLKDLDASNGVFTRNVGNYQSAFEAFGNKGMLAATNGVKKFKGALDMLKAHPIIATISILAAVIMGIVKAIEKNEEAVRKITKAFAPLKGIIDVVINTVDAFTGKIADFVANTLGKLADGLAKAFGGDLAKHMADERDIQAETYAIEEKRVELIRTEAETDAKILKLQKQLKAAKGDTNKQMEIAKQIDAELHKKNQDRYNLAKREYELIVLKNAQTQSGIKDLEAEANAYKEMVAAQAELNTHAQDYVTIMGKLDDKQKLSVLRSELEDLRTELKANNAEIKNLESNPFSFSFKPTIEELKARNKEIIEREKEVQADITEIEKKESEKRSAQYKTEKDKLIAEIEKDTEGMHESIIAYTEGNKALTDLSMAQLKDLQANLPKILAEDLAKWLNPFNTTKKAIIDGLKEVKVAEDEVNTNDKAQKAADELRKRVEGVVATYANAVLTESEVFQQQFKDLELAERTGLISHEEYLNAKKNLDEEYAKFQEENAKKEVNYMLDIANSFVDVLGTIADSMDEENEKQFNIMKAFQISAAIINTIAGAIGAFMGITRDTGGWGIAAAAAEAAAVTAAGVAQIVKISKTQYGETDASKAKGTGFNAAEVSAGKMGNDFINYSDVLNTNDVADSMRNANIYVSVDEIDRVSSRKRVAVAESRF